MFEVFDLVDEFEVLRCLRFEKFLKVWAKRSYSLCRQLEHLTFGANHVAECAGPPSPSLGGHFTSMTNCKRFASPTDPYLSKHGHMN